MAHPRKRAEYVETLIYLDEPQVLALSISAGLMVVAVAVPDNDPNKSMFLATTVRTRHWEAYLDGTVDLRYLFLYPRGRLLYYFDLMKMKNNKVLMEPFLGQIPDDHLPLPRLFSSDHTTEFTAGARASDKETLLIDGEWEMPEFGQFYQKYADVYAFFASTKNWADPTRPADVKAQVQNAFRTKPFQGGSSYVHFYHGLNDNLPRDERTSLDSIQYASPGTVNITGDAALFDEVERLVRTSLEKTFEIREVYSSLHSYMSKAGLLSMSGHNFLPNDPHAAYLLASAKTLCETHEIQNFNVISALAQSNGLVVAKIVLSLSRRIEEAAKFFAQGRMGFS